MVCIADSRGDETVGHIADIAGDATQRPVQVAPTDLQARPTRRTHQQGRNAQPRKSLSAATHRKLSQTGQHKRQTEEDPHGQLAEAGHRNQTARSETRQLVVGNRHLQCFGRLDGKALRCKALDHRSNIDLPPAPRITLRGARVREQPLMRHSVHRPEVRFKLRSTGVRGDQLRYLGLIDTGTLLLTQ
ncbi:Uncharacterised protein [Mycobacteroides abscessus subsp. abscessus]|nr:Uncharacterised protein [Mycobacteroides abscessus subsp. abscessus]